MGRTGYWNDPQAPKPNSLVPACGVLATDDEVHILRQRRPIPAGTSTQLLVPGLPMPRW